MKRYCKLIISTITIALIFTLCLSPASYALSRQQFAAWVGAALQAINITVSSIGIPIAQQEAQFIDYFNNPIKIVENQILDVPYTTGIDAIDEYMNRSVIKIDKDKVTIDGVDYTDIWLSTDAAEKFRVNAFDIENAFDIASQSEGKFVSDI